MSYPPLPPLPPPICVDGALACGWALTEGGGVGSGNADKITAASAKISRASIRFDRASCVFLRRDKSARANTHTHTGVHTRAATNDTGC